MRPALRLISRARKASRVAAFSSASRFCENQRQWSTPLAKRLAEAITTTGPIPVAAYMRQCLTDAEGGYYTSSASQFGAQGDFVTSPEISQVFGELVGVWLVAEWMAQGRRAGVELVEVGPGKGTLMSDIMRTIRNFKSFADSLDRVYLVETSSRLREEQKILLCGAGTIEQSDIGWTCQSKHGPEIVWCEDLRFVPRDPAKSPFIVAHEFFDALPIHVFESVPPSAVSTLTTSTTSNTPPKRRLPASNQWRELLISPAPAPSAAGQLSSSSTTSLLAKPKDLPPEFELIQSKAATPHSLYLPELSRRYKQLKTTTGAVIEISPESQAYAADFAVRIGGGTVPTPVPATSTSSKVQPLPNTPTTFDKPTPSGAALIFDYGPLDVIPANSLRGIRSHKMVSPLSSPGAVDLSADVDFMALAESAIEASPNIEVHGPLEQGTWLTAMGIAERVKVLMQHAENMGDSAKAREVEKSWKRLVERGGGGMGKIYKAMAIVPLSAGRRPVGFGGDVTG